MTPSWLWPVLGLLALLRLAELVYARVSARRLTAAGAKWVREDGYGALVAVHVLVLAGCAAEGWWAPWPQAGWWTVAGALLFAVGSALRYASMVALGWRWSTRVYTLEGHPLVHRGPYAWIRHPIYTGVFLELVAIPMVAGLWLTLGTVAALHALALRRRIRIEERALGLA